MGRPISLSPEQTRALERLYFDPSSVSSFGGAQTLYNAAKAEGLGLTLAKIKRWLSSKPTYTLYKAARVRYPRNRIMSLFPKHILQFDLASFTNSPEKLDGTIMRYLYVGVDSYSRYIFCVPIPDRRSTDIIAATKSVIATGYLPLFAYADPAGEHVSARTKAFFKQQRVHLYTTSSKIKAPQAERAIRSIRNYVTRYRHAFNSNSWIEAVKYFVKAYNQRKCRVTGQTPFDIMNNINDASHKAFIKLYPQGTAALPKTIHRKLPPIGETMRLSRLKPQFEKEGSKDGEWTRAYFTVAGVDKSKESPMIRLKDSRGKPILGKAYAQEIQSIDIEPETDVFEVHKILKRRIMGRQKQVLVHWKGYNLRESTWIPEANLKKLKANTRKTDVQ